MSLLTLEVELDHGHVIVKGSEALPDKASALLTILPATNVFPRHPLVPDPVLQQVVFHEDPSLPLEPGDWPGAFR